VLYMRLDVECGQQVMVISQLLQHLPHPPSPSVGNSWPVTVAVGSSWCPVTKLSKYSVRDKVSRDKYFFGRFCKISMYL